MEPGPHTTSGPAHVLVLHGTGRGDASAAARAVGDALAAHGLSCDVLPADRSPSPLGYDAAIVVGLQHGDRWDHHLRRVVRRLVRDAGSVPVWLVGVVPCGEGRSVRVLAPVSQLGRLGTRIRARGVVTLDLGGAGADGVLDLTGCEARGRGHVDDFALAVAGDLAPTSEHAEAGSRVAAAV